MDFSIRQTSILLLIASLWNRVTFSLHANLMLRRLFFARNVKVVIDRTANNKMNIIRLLLTNIYQKLLTK